MPSVRFSIVDESGERSSHGLWLGNDAVTNLNYDAFAASVTALQAATDAITLASHAAQFKAIDESPTQATDPYAQREAKWRVRYQSTVSPFKKYSVDIPAPDLTKKTAGSQFADLSETDVAAYVTAFETEVREPDTDNTVTVLSIQHVGANI